VDPSCLELEITESTIMQEDDITGATLIELREMGIGLALDDFGTGYSSLSHLRRFPLTRVKIDRSFVKEIPGNASDSALTAAVINMAHSLGLRVVAEGVETPEQAEFLREMGCDEFQGFLFSPAVPSEDYGRLLREGWGT
jgi:EAL domain-containing protein (putative c-di-GMP-specific phosphodiesterase class I)